MTTLRALLIALALCVPVFAQTPVPGSPTGAPLGQAGLYPFRQGGSLQLTSDADFTLTTYPQTAQGFIKITSSVALTAVRTATLPTCNPSLTNFTVAIENATTGGQSINLGPGVTVVNASAIAPGYGTAICDGTRYIAGNTPSTLIPKDISRIPSTLGNNLGVTGGGLSIRQTGNSTTEGQEKFFTGMIQSGLLPLSYRHWNGTLVCTATGPGGQGVGVATGIDNAGMYLNVGDNITFGNEVPSALIDGAPSVVTAASATSVTFTSNSCTSFSGGVDAIVTNQYNKCAQNGGSLAGFLTPGGGGGGAECSPNMLHAGFDADVAAGKTIVFINRGYLINDVRQGADTFAQALALEKQLFDMVNGWYPNIPMLLIGENSLTQGDSGHSYVVPVATTVTSGAITAGTNTVTVATMPTSLWPGAGTPLVWNFPNGSPYQVVLDTGGSQETVNITGMTATTITFTNANSHSAGFTLIATRGTAAQSYSAELHQVTVAMSGYLPNLDVMDTQLEEYGLQSNLLTSPAYYINELHPNVDGQAAEGAQAARHIASFPQVNTALHTVRTGSGQAIMASGNITLNPTPVALDPAFTLPCGNMGRLNSYANPEIGCLFADEDPVYNDPLIMGTLSGVLNSSSFNATFYTEPPPVGIGNGIQPGDKICVLGQGCFNNSQGVAQAFGSNGVQVYFPTGANGFTTAPLSQAVVYHPKIVGAGSEPFFKNPNTFPSHASGIVYAAGTGSFTLELTGGNGGVDQKGRAASDISLIPSDYIVVQGTGNETTAFTINATTNCVPSTLFLLCTDSSGTNYSSWTGHRFDTWSTRASDATFSATTQTLATTASLTVQGLVPPTIPVIAVQPTSGVLSDGVTQCYRITAYNAIGESLPGPEQCQTTNAGTSTQFLQPFWRPVEGALGYKVYGRTSGAELYMATVTGAPNNSYAGLPAYTINYFDTNSITPAGAMPTTDGSTLGINLKAATPTVGAGAVGFGSETAAATNCNAGGTLTGVAGCYVVNVGTRRSYLPYF